MVRWYSNNIVCRCIYHKGNKYGLLDIYGNKVEVDKKELVQNNRIKVINIDNLGMLEKIDIGNFIKIVLSIDSRCTMTNFYQIAMNLDMYKEYRGYILNKVRKLMNVDTIRIAYKINEKYTKNGYANIISNEEVAEFRVVYGRYPISVEEVHDRR